MLLSIGYLMLIKSNFSYSRDFVIFGALWCNLDQTKLFSFNPNFWVLSRVI